MRNISSTTQRVGFWSALLSTLFSLAYVVGQLAEWGGLLGSHGGPESLSTPLGLVILLAPSLFLGIAFLVLVVSINQLATSERQIWSQLAVAFAIAYMVLISVVYFTQLTLVTPHLAQGEIESIQVFLFVPFDSFLYAVDILGYSFMSLSMLFAAGVFGRAGLEPVIRRSLIANGCLLPFIALQMYWHSLIWIAALWGLFFPSATGALTVFFQRAAIALPSAPDSN